MFSYSKNYKLKFYLCFVFLLYFLSNNIIYAHLEENNEYLIPMGNIIQIDAELDGILVRNEFKNSPFNIGDRLISVDDINISDYDDYAFIMSKIDSHDKVEVLVSRGYRNIKIDTSKSVLEKTNFNNFISGFATLTYIDPSNNQFAAVAHPISVGGYNEVTIKNGSISTTSSLNITKSRKYNVGCINATRLNTIGTFSKNTNFGIKGDVEALNLGVFKKYEVASLDEVKLGDAQVILQNTKNQPGKYDITILDIQNQKKARSKTFKIKITDEKLLDLTGGIVQGMSGTPIVQDDKIIGAISHALENDPSVGYGVYIKWMMD